MKIYTGNFANVKKYRDAGLHTIGIALSARYYTGDHYKALAPDWSFKDDPEESYKIKFSKKLSLLNKEDIKKELFQLSGGKALILLCHEKFGVFCHRHIVNEWLNGEGEFGKNVIKVEQKELF